GRPCARARPAAPAGRPAPSAAPMLSATPLRGRTELRRARPSEPNYCTRRRSVCEGVVRQDERAPFVEALRHARESAFQVGEYVEQESFMRAREIRELARHAGIAPGVAVLDLCCGVAGPGRFLTQELGCAYLGVDSSASAVEIARTRANGLTSRFEVARVPPLPPGTFEV